MPERKVDIVRILLTKGEDQTGLRRKLRLIQILLLARRRQQQPDCAVAEL